MTGIHEADAGEITMEGKPVRFANPRQAAAGGLGVVHQERNLVTRFSVAENIMLDRLGAHSLSPVDYKALAEEAAALAEAARPRHRSDDAGLAPQRGADAARRDRQGAVAASRACCCWTSPRPR